MEQLILKMQEATITENASLRQSYVINDTNVYENLKTNLQLNKSLDDSQSSPDQQRQTQNSSSLAIEGPKVILSKHPMNPEGGGYMSPVVKNSNSSPLRVEYAPIPIRERSIEVHHLPDS